MTRPDIVRTLPLRVTPENGESLHSWLLRLSRRNSIPLLRLAQAIGLSARLAVPHNYALSWKLPPELLRRIETQIGLTAGTLDGMLLDRFDPLSWKPIAGSRYCTACLRESGGVWQVRWQLRHVFACLTHHQLLAAVCPGCGRSPHGAALSLRAGSEPSTSCVLGARREARPCRADLLTHPAQALHRHDIRLKAQHWINQRIDHPRGQALRQLHDLDALATWFLTRLDPADLAYLGHETGDALTEYRADNHGVKGEQSTAPLISAALACQAIKLLSATAKDRYQRMAPLLRGPHHDRQPGAPTKAPTILPRGRLLRLSEPLQRRLLTAADPHLPITERLRYRTRTPNPAPPPADSNAAQRARFIPQYLWPDWIVRLMPVRGRYLDDLAVDVPRALMLPGNLARNTTATTELGAWRHNVSVYLTDTARSHPDILNALCQLADYLDTQGGAIDHRRRRETFPTVELSEHDWNNICHTAQTHPGREARLLHARRYLFQLLTGGDLTNRSHPLALRNSLEREGYLAWQYQMPSQLRSLIQQRGNELLAAAGISEPLTWSPPASIVAGLTLPGRDPGDIDTKRLRYLAITAQLPVTAAAQQLGVHPEHVRYALQQHDRPPPQYGIYSTVTARITRAHAAEILTPSFFERENTQAGKDINTLAAETRVSRKLIVHFAQLAGHTFIRIKQRERIKVPKARRGDHIDQAWLHEQAGKLFRTNDDIAAELGLRGETIRRYRARYNIRGRPTGSGGHVITNLKHPNLPKDIRKAVEGERSGWQRLQRFQQMLDYSSMNLAAQNMGLHTQNLNQQIQRLETDIGAQLIHRAPHRYAPMAATQRGKRLLGDLTRPDIAELLARYASANALPKASC